MSTEHESHFIVPLKYYVGTFIALLILTVVTVAVTLVDLGSTMNIILAMGIAALKASLVALFFMGLRWEKGFNALFFIGSLIFLAIFIIFTLADIHTRKYTDKVEGIRLPPTVKFETKHHGDHGDHGKSSGAHHNEQKDDHH